MGETAVTEGAGLLKDLLKAGGPWLFVMFVLLIASLAGNVVQTWWKDKKVQEAWDKADAHYNEEAKKKDKEHEADMSAIETTFMAQINGVKEQAAKDLKEANDKVMTLVQTLSAALARVDETLKTYRDNFMRLYDRLEKSANENHASDLKYVEAISTATGVISAVPALIDASVAKVLSHSNKR